MGATIEHGGGKGYAPALTEVDFRHRADNKQTSVSLAALIVLLPRGFHLLIDFLCIDALHDASTLIDGLAGC